MSQQKPQRAAASPARGRPEVAPGGTRRINVTLDEATLQTLAEVGDSNVSEGIRRLAAAHRESAKGGD